MAEAYFQHAEHYFRILGAMNQAQMAQGGQSQPPQGSNQNRRYQQDEQQDQGEPEGEAETVPPVRGEPHAVDNDRLAEAIEAELTAESDNAPREAR